MKNFNYHHVSIRCYTNFSTARGIVRMWQRFLLPVAAIEGGAAARLCPHVFDRAIARKFAHAK